MANQEGKTTPKSGGKFTPKVTPKVLPKHQSTGQYNFQHSTCARRPIVITKIGAS